MPRHPSGAPHWRGVGLKLPPDVLEQVRRHGDIHNLTLSQIVREALEQYFHAEGAPSAPRDTIAAVRELLSVAVGILDASMVRVQVGQAVPEGAPVEVPTAPVQGVEQSKLRTKAAVVARIQQLHAEGASLSAIARRLEAEKVPTLRGKPAWQKGTVDRLLHPRAKG